MQLYFPQRNKCISCLVLSYQIQKHLLLNVFSFLNKYDQFLQPRVAQIKLKQKLYRLVQAILSEKCISVLYSLDERKVDASLRQWRFP